MEREILLASLKIKIYPFSEFHTQWKENRMVVHLFKNMVFRTPINTGLLNTYKISYNPKSLPSLFFPKLCFRLRKSTQIFPSQELLIFHRCYLVLPHFLYKKDIRFYHHSWGHKYPKALWVQRHVFTTFSDCLLVYK